MISAFMSLSCWISATTPSICDAMLAIARKAEESPDVVRAAPTRAPLRRLDEATAARKPVLRGRREGY